MKEEMVFTKSDLDKIDRAFEFATIKHKGQYRKGTKIPYIVHLYDVYMLLKEENAPIDVLIGGILHDTIEDTDTQEDEIIENFGDRVASYVKCESEDKSLPYMERKRQHMEKLSKENDEVKLINCADKLSNLRAIYLDYCYIGEEFFKRFNGSKEEIPGVRAPQRVRPADLERRHDGRLHLQPAGRGVLQRPNGQRGADGHRLRQRGVGPGLLLPHPHHRLFGRGLFVGDPPLAGAAFRVPPLGHLPGGL